jgi:MYXO-CTERM domain-containing protein
VKGSLGCRSPEAGHRPTPAVALALALALLHRYHGHQRFGS